MCVHLTLYKGKVVCPRCDGNGLLYQTTIQPINQTIIICDECEAIWPSGSCITSSNFQDFSTYIHTFGYSYTTVKETNCTYDWMHTL